MSSNLRRAPLLSAKGTRITSTMPPTGRNLSGPTLDGPVFLPNGIKVVVCCLLGTVTYRRPVRSEGGRGAHERARARGQVEVLSSCLLFSRQRLLAAIVKFISYRYVSQPGISCLAHGAGRATVGPSRWQELPSYLEHVLWSWSWLEPLWELVCR